MATKLCVTFTFVLAVLLPASLKSSCGSSELDAHKIKYAIDPLFKPDLLIKQQLPEDLALLGQIRKLFFEADGTANPKRDVYRSAVREHGGQEIVLLTHDDMRISALYFKRDGAPVNIIYVTGYFNDLTPTKEWSAPFALLFSEYNVLSFDWRGFGNSEGVHGMFCQNSFGKNAYPDIQAAVDFMHKENDKPVVLVGFCFGAAMAMHATVQATKEHKRTADALVLNCLFTKFQNQFNRAVDDEDRCLYKIILASGLGQEMLEFIANGSLFEVNPIDLIKEIKIPCYFEHYSDDPFSPLSEGVEVYNAAICPKIFMQSDQGRHARIHSKVPYQYRQGFIDFLHRFGFVPK